MLFSVLNLVLGAAAGLLTTALLLRFWMQVARVRPPMQVAQFTFQFSDWLVKPLRRIIPGVGGIDWASLVGALLIVLLYTFIGLQAWALVSVETLLLQALLRLLQWSLYGFFGLLILEIIFSWVNPHAPLAPFVRALNDPVLGRLRRVIPSLGGLDFSVFIAALLLQILLYQIGRYLIPIT